jgi:hypothetical protein
MLKSTLKTSQRMRASISKYALLLLLGFPALGLAGSVRAFQDGITHSPMPSSVKDTRYEWIMSALGLLNGVGVSNNSYRAPDGERIDTSRATIGSADGDAAKTFHQEIDHSAAEIIKQGDILDESGRVIGYRSVLTLVDKDGKKFTAIVITKRADFREYISSSAPAALAFEEYANSLAAEHVKK